MTNEEIVCRIKQGEDLYSTLIEKNMGLFKKIHSIRDPFHYLEHEDAMSVCYGTLYRCVQRWDEKVGTKFVSFLYTAILRDLSLHTQREGRVKHCLISANQKIMTEDDELEYLNIIEAPLNRSLENCTMTDQGLIKEAVMVILSGVKEPKRSIVKDYFFEDVTQKELAMKYSFSQAHVSRIILNTQELLREKLPEHGFSVNEIHGETFGY